MRADIHDGPERTLQSEAGYIDARPYCRIDENLLHRTAGPYIGSDSEKLAMSTMGPLCPEQLTQEETSDGVCVGPEAGQEGRTKESGAGGAGRILLASSCAFGLSSRNPTAVRPATAASGEDFVSAIGSIIDATRAVPPSAASSLGIFTLLLTSP